MPEQRIAVLLPEDKGGGSLEYDPAEGEWSAEGGRAAEYLGVARDAGRPWNYAYSPADGYPGCRLAQVVAERLGGKAVFENLPPLPKGAIP